MSLEVVDLLDSSEEEGEKKSAPPIDDDSSSSDDDILYAPSIFSQGGSSKSAATSNNNNAANVCKKNDNHENGDGIPKKLTIKEQCDEDQVDGRNTAASKAKTNYYPTFGPQRGTSIKPDDEIIEVGSSSDEDFNPILRAPKATEPPEVSKKGQDEFNDSDDDDCIALDQSKLSSGSFCNNENWCTLQENANSHENVVHNSYKPASPRTTSGSDVPLTKQKPISPKNNTFTTTNCTCDSAQSPNTSDFRVHSEDDENTHNNFVEMDKTTRKSADFSFEVHGGFDEVESDSDVDTNPTSTTYQSKHNANTTAQSVFLRDHRHPNRAGVDSDDDSISSVPLFTPRPLKKVKGSKPTKPAVAASAMFASKSGKCLDESSSPEMMTPCAFSPPSNSPLTTFVAKKKVPVPAIPAMPPELIQSIGGKLYPDLKHSFLLALTHHARKARHASYERSIFDSALRSIVVLCLHLNPLRSPEAARRIKGVGGNMYEILKKSTSGPDAKPPFVPKQNKYSCVAGAALVALLELEEENMSGEQYFSMEDLISKVNELLDSRTKAFLNQTIEKYLDPDTLDPNWGQVKKLCYTNSSADFNGPFIKERKKKAACTSGIVFELLDIGREMAVKLREIAKAPPIEHGPLRQLPSDTVDEEFGNVTMSMDLREGGGSGKSLHKMCDHLDTRGVPYVVRELKIADYIWFVGNKLAPVLVERKTADDVAASLHDGRWEKQQRNMRKAQYILGGGEDRKCQICYIIEGNANKRKVHGGNVGRRSWCQSVEDVENAIKELPSLGFSVMRSKGHLDTIGILAKIAADISWKVKNGVIDVKFTYEQFLRLVNQLSNDKGNPPTSREHQNPAPPVVVNVNNTSQPVPSASAIHEHAHEKPVQSSETENSQEFAELNKLSIAALKEQCKERGEKLGGNKADLIARLIKPRKPEILIMRMRRNEYVPKVPSSNAALMVALLLKHVPGTQGMTKERLMVLAEETGVCKESMSGDGGFYDGWSGMKQLLEGDPALVRREKGHRYSLTTQPPESAGVAVASALHILAHREDLCTCGSSL